MIVWNSQRNCHVSFYFAFYINKIIYEYYDNYHIKKNDNYDELDVKLHDTVFDFKELYKVDAESIHNFMKKHFYFNKYSHKK